MAATADSPSVPITVGEIRNGKGLHLLVMILQIRSIPRQGHSTATEIKSGLEKIGAPLN